MTPHRRRPVESAGGAGRPRLRAGAAGTVAGFGAAFLGQHVVIGGPSLLQRGLRELPLLVLAIALVYGGYWLLGSALDARRVGRVAAWSAVGLVGLVAVAVWLRPLAAGPVGGLFELTADVGTVGAAAGLLVGLETVREPTRAGSPSTDGGDPRFEHFNRQLRHHLLNGTAVIKGHAELLVDADGPDAEAAAVIRSRADELADVARTVAALGLAETGELPTAPVDAVAALRTAVDRVERERPQAALVVDVGSPGRVRGTAELGTAFVALLRAAVDAADGGAVRVTATPDGDALEIRFDYDGPPPVGLGREGPTVTGELSLRLAETLVAAAEGRVVGPTASGFAVRLPTA